MMKHLFEEIGGNNNNYNNFVRETIKNEEMINVRFFGTKFY